jgi:hypothetical protein
MDDTLIDFWARRASRLCWLPVRVRQWPYQIIDGFRRRVMDRRYDPVGGVHATFFTCRGHFHLVECALESLTLLGSPYLKGVSVFVDEGDFFDADQLAALDCLWHSVRVEPWPRITGWGPETVARQVRAFAKVAEGLDPDDYIAKIDSDLLFIDRWIFPLVLRSGVDVVGDGRYIDFRYFQGGCYFIRRSLVPLLEPYGDGALLKALFPGPGRGGGEDELTHRLVRHVGARIWLTRFMAFPDEFKRFRVIGTRERDRYCTMHFVKRKETMRHIHRLQVLPVLRGAGSEIP